MKPSRQKIFASLRERLLNYEEIESSDAESIISVELMLYGCLLFDSTIKLEDSWAIFSGHNQPIVKKYSYLPIINRLRILLPEYRFENYWKNELTNYFNYKKKIRLFDKEEGKIIQIKPQLASERERIYHEAVSRPLRKLEDERSFVKNETFRYTRLEEGVEKVFSGNIPHGLVAEKESLLPLYKNKLDVFLNPDEDWKMIVDEMDKKTDNYKGYRSRVESLVLKSITPSQQKRFHYNGNMHIGGGLSAGKSTMMVIETFRVVTKYGGKVGFIEGSVAQVLERVKELRALGIKAAPIIGKSNRKTHEKNALMSKAKKINEVTDIAQAENELFSLVSDRCTIKALAKDFDRNNYFPCTNLHTNGKKMKCPLAYTCGVYKEIAKLNEADVWVATSASILKSKLPAVIDPFERTVYEAMYDLLDVIFVDEADHVQKQFDEAFISEIPAFGKSNNLFEIEMSRAMQKTTGKYQKYASDKLISRWRSNLHLLDTIIWKLFDKINTSKHLRSYLRNQIIWTRTLISEISKKLSGEREQRDIQKELWEYANNPLESNGLGELADKLQKTESVEEKQEIINQLIKTVGGEIKEKSNIVLINDLIELFMYLARLDMGIKFLLTYYPAVQNRLGTGSDGYYQTSVATEYQAYMKEAMTGFMLGYRYDMKENDDIGSFKLIEYFGIGRFLLTEWHQIFENAYGNKGPALVLLSGTSHLPGSVHYHLNIEPKWIIESNRKRSVIMQQFFPKYDEKRERDITVSGTENRKENLRKLAASLKADIQWELNYWKSKKERRGVILVVNSYEDVVHVGEAFIHDSKWKGRFRLLSKENKNDDIWYPRSLIEQFSETGAEVLVAPLLAVGRGYNILNENREALFGSAFFLVRPYPIPNDMTFIIQSLHANLEYFYREIEDEGLTYADGLKKLRNLSRRRFEHMYQRPDFWSILSEKEREILSWYIFVPVWQMIGRLLRGGKDANIYYCDAKFHEKVKGGHSLLEYWQKLMHKYDHEAVFQALYGPFIKSIDDVIQEDVF
ncbi:hypothetical protein KGR20_03225 [Cytobacillus oceanisediminis]|uniref:pPIWI_RE_Z domain-containing protein n=1 Tax=Cytobacillus oceanisediminis TaxID=665099 RepID=UPI001CCB9839|nr:hypothetical protein [Cytobacillus oceanisediminis]MBZ9533268.1 hypothetical protein [Cytobacillus oceanisediminis]